MNNESKVIYEVERAPSWSWRMNQWQVIRETARSWIVEAPYYVAGKRIAKTAGLDDRPVENVFLSQPDAQTYLRREIYDAVRRLLWQLPQDDELRRAISAVFQRGVG
jgi:hypothetical protein